VPFLQPGSGDDLSFRVSGRDGANLQIYRECEIHFCLGGIADKAYRTLPKRIRLSEVPLRGEKLDSKGVIQYEARIGREE